MPEVDIAVYTDPINAVFSVEVAVDGHVHETVEAESLSQAWRIHDDIMAMAKESGGVVQ